MGNTDNIANLSALYHQLQELSAIHKTIDRALQDLPITRFDRYKAIEEAATAMLHLCPTLDQNLEGQMSHCCNCFYPQACSHHLPCTSKFILCYCIE